jgi:hypothetical protein
MAARRGPHDGRFGALTLAALDIARVVLGGALVDVTGAEIFAVDANRLPCTARSCFISRPAIEERVAVCGWKISTACQSAPCILMMHITREGKPLWKTNLILVTTSKGPRMPRIRGRLSRAGPQSR